MGIDFYIYGTTVFVLAGFLGFFVVSRVTPALHTPLMSVTNAISGVVLIGAMVGLDKAESLTASIICFIAMILSSINIFGGFFITQKMLDMFSVKKGGK